MWIYSYFDSVIMQFMIINRADTRKTDVNLLNCSQKRRVSNPLEGVFKSASIDTSKNLLAFHHKCHPLMGYTILLYSYRIVSSE